VNEGECNIIQLLHKLLW